MIYIIYFVDGVIDEVDEFLVLSTESLVFGRKEK